MTDDIERIREGYALAVTMLQEFEAASPEELGESMSLFCSDGAPGTDDFAVCRREPQRNLVLGYLDKLQSQEVREGFAAVLTDWIASARHFVLHSSAYDGIAERHPLPHLEVPMQARIETLHATTAKSVEA